MAKKIRRNVSNVSDMETAATVTAGAETAQPAIRRTLTTEFNPDYTPVIKDLKRIGVLAASFLVVLVVLSFILR
ncbi:MAG TPA: hypothetical protein PKW33_00040 [Anaerolineaceae bacterium]|nr:hypothetical protein [Anaerolineaceae bacterium]HPN49947.1 hypothetical protein [Anaerolineaceae bacterium]